MEVQNIYIGRIVWFGGIIGLLQVAAIVALVIDGRREA